MDASSCVLREGKRLEVQLVQVWRRRTARRGRESDKREAATGVVVVPAVVAEEVYNIAHSREIIEGIIKEQVSLRPSLPIAVSHASPGIGYAQVPCT